MRLERIRIAAQVASFGLLTYGGRIGIKLGHFLPCFACPYVGGCAGHCYLMALQGPIWGLQIPLPMLIGAFGLGALGMFAGFAALTILLSKTWCGWICPFGTLQDWLTSLRRRLAIRESRIPWGIMDRLKLVKYLLLLLLLLIPALIANASLHPDLRLPFCQICPAKPLMPLFEGNTSHLALNLSNPITIGMSALSVALAGGFLVGTFFKDRFFCVFCPMLALISVFDRIGLLRLKKKRRFLPGLRQLSAGVPRRHPGGPRREKPGKRPGASLHGMPKVRRRLPPGRDTVFEVAEMASVRIVEDERTEISYKRKSVDGVDDALVRLAST